MRSDLTDCSKQRLTEFCLPRQLPPLTIICFRTSGQADALQTGQRSATVEWRNVAARLSKRL
ncbi:hypothetical protein T08_6722 [Trichinella sp. T8]|nr:hypothetical protein T08_6722 [Trichinella sp. T8]